MDSLAIAIIEIRHEAGVSRHADTPRDIIKLFAYAPDVHVDDDRGKRPVLFRLSYERIHDSAGSGDFNESLVHPLRLSKFAQRFWAIFGFSMSVSLYKKKAKAMQT